MVYLFIFAHLVADFVLQPLWLVRRKCRWDGLFIHVSVVLLCMLGLIVIEPGTRMLWPAMLAISGVHLVTDRWKVRYADRLFHAPLVSFIFDQIIHIVTIVTVLRFCLPAAALWSLASSPLSLPAIYATCYVVAALAVPIGMIVALDPTFQHASLATTARLRSMMAATLVLSLALFAGPIALPATLAGVVVVVRRPASCHPLDSPIGLMAVLTVAASLGTILAMVM
ncbi:MAG: DUF3307 domain-containing protein [Oscillochloris sp.]|nr:DUF3307 domain-containing protein [Oscillochloris sp.]